MLSWKVIINSILLDHSKYFGHNDEHFLKIPIQQKISSPGIEQESPAYQASALIIEPSRQFRPDTIHSQILVNLLVFLSLLNSCCLLFI